MTGGAGIGWFYIFDTAATLDRADRITDFSGYGGVNDIILISLTSVSPKPVWFRRFDADGDGDRDTVLYDNAEGDGGIYVILLDYDEALTSDDFGAFTGTVTEIA